MGLFNSARGREADDEPADEGGAPEPTGRGGGRRRWLLAGLVAAVAVGLYLRSKRRAAREAEFTEIELDPVDSETESEPTSTE
jgi:hypothetical protein